MASMVYTLDKPRLTFYKDMITIGEAEALVELARPTLKNVDQRLVYSSSGAKLPPRTYMTTQLGTDLPLIQQLNRRFSELVSCELDSPFRVFRYLPGDFLVPHIDRQVQPVGDGRETTTLLVYLTQPGGGGSTFFPRAKVGVLPQQCNGIVFTTTHGGVEDPMSLHGSDKVTAGEKWVLSKWFLR